MSRIEMAMEKAAQLRQGAGLPLADVAEQVRPEVRGEVPVAVSPQYGTLAPDNPFLVNLHDPHCPTAEEYRKLKSVLVKMTTGATFKNCIMVTSSVPSEGKSLTALNLALSLAQGFFNSLQFTSMNAMAYADIDPKDSSMASTMGSSMQQLSMSFGLACGSLITAWYLGDVPQSEKLAVTSALHHAFLTLGAVTLISSLSFWTLKPDDGNAVSRGAQVPA